MISISFILIVCSHKICGLVLLEKDADDVFKKINKHNQRVQAETWDSIINELVKLIHNIEKPHRLKSHPKQIALNDQLNEGQGFYEDIRGGPNDYSKVYLVLNPESNLSSSDVKDINNLVSSLLSKPVFNKKATFKDHHKDKGIRHYKGFVIRDNRRRFKESREKFVPKDSMENDYKPKRGRGDHGGGGRTAIPYIRHRGDIYEKD